MNLEVDLLDDGGIRVTAPGSSPGLASRRMALDWVGVAAERGWTVTIRGGASSPVGAALSDAAAGRSVAVSSAADAPSPWPRGWSSLQMAASSGLTEQVQDLVARGASMSSRRRDETPYRLAMRHGHVDTLVALRGAGATPPAGSQPPAELPGAVVLRNYLPAFIWWVAIAAGVLGLVLAIVLQQWPFVLVAASGAAAILVGNLVIGATRIAVDGPRLSVRQVRSWQGPVDLRELVALGFWKATSTRMSSRWWFVQTTAGPAFGRAAHGGFDPALLAELRPRDDLRVVTIYSGRGFLSPGLERHIGRHVAGTPARISANAQSVLDELGTRRAGGL
jgi:hypothetical protein